MSEPIRVEVKIDQRKYHLVSGEPAEHLHKVAELVNGKMEEIAQRNQFIGTDLKMMLTALNLAEDLLKLQQENEVLRRQNAAGQGKTPKKTQADAAHRENGQKKLK